MTLPVPGVDGTGQTIDFRLSAGRDKRAARRFLYQALRRENTRHPREIVTDRLKSYPGTLRTMKRAGELGRFVRHRRGRWLNNLVEQDHRRIKRRVRPMLGFKRFTTARCTLAAVEAMAVLSKGQVRAVPRNDLPAQRAFVQQIFGVAADPSAAMSSSAWSSGMVAMPNSRLWRALARARVTRERVPKPLSRDLLR